MNNNARTYLSNVNNIINLIYDAPTNPDLWTSTLNEMAYNVDAVGSIMGVQRFDDTLGWRCSPSLEPEASQYFHNYMHGPADISNKIIRLNSVGFVADHLVFTDEELKNTSYMKEFGSKKNLYHGAATHIQVPNGDCILFYIARAAQKPPFNEEDINWLDAIRPHLARASLLSVQLGFQRIQASLDGMGMIGFPAILINEDRKPIMNNCLLKEYDSFIRFSPDKTINFYDKRGNQALKHAIEKTKQKDNLVSLSIPIISKNNERGIAHLLPITGAYRDIFDWNIAFSEDFQKSCCALIITPVQREATTDNSLLKGLFDLTPTESKVAEALTHGLSVKQVSEKYRISNETVRTHLKSIFSKTGVNRQSQLVAVLSGVSNVRYSVV